MGGSAADSSGRGNNGTLTGGTAWSTTALVDLGTANVCEHEPVSGAGCCFTAADCVDGNPCTDDVCSGGSCQNPANTASCNDSNPCTSPDACSGGTCGGTPIPGCTSCSTDAHCNDANDCTTDACSTANDAAADLRGASDYVNLGQDATANNFINNFGNSSFTVEGWFYADGLTANLTSLFRAGRQGAFPQVVVQLNNSSGNYLAGSVESNAGLQVDTPNTAATITLNAWHHFALVVDRAGAQVRIYLNGNLGGTVAIPGGWDHGEHADATSRAR